MAQVRLCLFGAADRVVDCPVSDRRAQLRDRFRRRHPDAGPNDDRAGQPCRNAAKPRRAAYRRCLLAGLRPANRRADPAAAPAGRRRGPGAGGRAGAQGAGPWNRLSRHRGGRPDSGQRTDPRRRDRDDPRSAGDRPLYRFSLRMAVRHRRDGLDLARCDHHGRAVRAIPPRIQSDHLGRDPHGRRLLGQRHRGDLRPHPGVDAKIPDDAVPRSDQPCPERNLVAHHL